MTEPYQVHARPIPAHPPAPHVPEGPREELFDWQRVGQMLRFALGSIRRRPLLFASVAGSMVALAAFGLAVLPKTYEVECRLLAQKNAVLAVRADANMAEQPTRAAAEIIVRRDNLLALIRQTNLLEEWPKRRAPALRVKDWLMRKLKGPVKEHDLLDGLIGLLEKQLMVWVTPDGAVTIRLQWPDGLTAYRLVDAAQQNFLETRQMVEISTIAEQIGILEGHSEKLKVEIEKDVAELQRLKERTGSRTRRGRPAPPPLIALPDTSQEVLALRAQLEGKRRALAELEEFRRRRLNEQQARLAELRAVYSETNPVVVDLQQGIEALQKESPQQRTLREEEANLREQLARKAGPSLAGANGAPAIPQELFRADPDGESPAVEYARAQLRFAAGQYASMRERIDTARIELDTARAAFKYRYSVVVPAEEPRGPIKPKGALVMVASLLAGLVLAWFATTLADLRSGAVIERWQIEQLLGAAGTIVEVRTR